MRFFSLMAFCLLAACGDVGPAQHFQPGLWEIDPEIEEPKEGEPAKERTLLCLSKEDAEANRFDTNKWFPPLGGNPVCPRKSTLTMGDGKIQTSLRCSDRYRSRMVNFDIEGKFTRTSFEVRVYDYAYDGSKPPAPQRKGWDKKVHDAAGKADPNERGWGPIREGKRVGDCES